jgi:hypothetical protein
MHCTGEVFIAEALRSMPEKIVRSYVGTKFVFDPNARSLATQVNRSSVTYAANLAPRPAVAPETPLIGSPRSGKVVRTCRAQHPRT